MPRPLAFACFAFLVCNAFAVPSLTPLGSWKTGAPAQATLRGIAEVSNPFDPEVVSVDVTITAPSGAITRLPAYWYQDFTRTLTPTGEVVAPTGEASWRLKFMPLEQGTYKFHVAVQPANEEVDTSLEVLAGTSTAYVRVASDRRSLLLKDPAAAGETETEATRYLRLIGENVCWPEAGGTFDYEKWFSAMHDSGQNFARLWLCPWWAGLEHNPTDLTRYPLANSWRLDQIFEAAERNGIYLLLCLDHHGMYQVNNQNWGGSNNYWKTNPYAQANGGPCANPNDFFTDARARELYQKRLRYLIARYSWSPRLLAWQFFNEIDNTFLQQVNGGDCVAWHQLMARWLKANDPVRHLVTTSLTGGSDRKEFWSLPDMDLSMYHSYSDPAPGKKLDALARDFVTRYQKPVMIGEFGMDAASWHIEIDPHLRGFRQALWSGALGGSVGTSMSWWWESIHRDRVYPLYKNFSDIMAKAGWETGAWYPADTTAVAPQSLAGTDVQEVFTANLPLNLGRRLPLSGSWVVDSPLAADRASEGLSAFLYGTKNPNLPSTLRLTANLAEGAKLTFRVNAVASDNQLVLTSNGVEKFRTGFANVDNRAQMNHEIDREFTIDLPAGPQTLELSNIGNDWTGLDTLRLSNVLPAPADKATAYLPEISALRSTNRLVAYITSPHTVYPAGRLTYHPAPVFEARHVIHRWPAGKFIATWYFPTSGRAIASNEVEAVKGDLTLAHPNFEDDLVCVVLPVP